MILRINLLFSLAALALTPPGLTPANKAMDKADAVASLRPGLALHVA